MSSVQLLVVHPHIASAVKENYKIEMQWPYSKPSETLVSDTQWGILLYYYTHY